MLEFALFCAVLQVTQTPPVPAESVALLQHEARASAARYESTARLMAPFTLTAREGSPCDENVGRFCLRFDAGEAPPPDVEEHGRVVEARNDALDALRRAFAADATDRFVAGHLARYLVEADRASEAVSVARAFRWAADDDPWADLLLGYTLHAAEELEAASTAFLEGLGRVTPDERRRLETVDVLLDPGERRVYDAMSADEQVDYERSVWKLADPLFLLPGNERWNEHLARRVAASIMAETPVTHGMVSWGTDLEELTARYGVPASRARAAGTGIADLRLVEYFDREQLALFPSRLLTEGLDSVPGAGDSWGVFERRARSRYEPRSIRRLVRLPHQVSRFPATGDTVVVRWDAMFSLDSTAVSALKAPEASRDLATGLFVIDTTYGVQKQLDVPLSFRDDSVFLSVEQPLPADGYIYSLEAFEPLTDLAARARFSLKLQPFAADSLALSDLVLCRPFGTGRLPEDRADQQLRPHAELVFSPGDTVGIYAEIHRLEREAAAGSSYRVEIALRDAGVAPVLTRLIRRIGRVLGVGRDGDDPFLAWDATGSGDEVEIIALDLYLPRLRTGPYVLEVAVFDYQAGYRRIMERELLIKGES